MILDSYKLVFWDFDGVIKESIQVKIDAFVELFLPYGKVIINRIRKHHLENGGMSRFEKIPLYLNWTDIKPTSDRVNEMCKKFSQIVKNKVIESSWVPGVKKFLYDNNKKHLFVLVSATPQEELIDICKSLSIESYFFKIYGAPNTKFNAIKASIKEHHVPLEKCILFGDSQADIDAAKQNNIDFVFRRHQYNQNLVTDSFIQVINDFKDKNIFF